MVRTKATIAAARKERQNNFPMISPEPFSLSEKMVDYHPLYTMPTDANLNVLTVYVYCEHT